ncbi:MAG: hypothetical protein R2702_19540 [Acidimicrobiales bacterium]
MVAEVGRSLAAPCDGPAAMVDVGDLEALDEIASETTLRLEAGIAGWWCKAAPDLPLLQRRPPTARRR